jgi:hypothetical protein
MDESSHHLATPYCLGRYKMPSKPFSHLIFWWQSKKLRRDTCHLRWRIRNKRRILAARKGVILKKTMVIAHADPERKAFLRAMKARHMRTWRAKKAAQRSRLRS